MFYFTFSRYINLCDIMRFPVNLRLQVEVQAFLRVFCQAIYLGMGITVKQRSVKYCIAVVPANIYEDKYS